MNTQSLFQFDMLLQVVGMTPGRAAIILPAVMGLISVVVGRWALKRSAVRLGSTRFMAIMALVLGLVDIVLSAVHLARATGNIGTGSGKLGAIVALVLGLSGVILAGLALTRHRKNAAGSNTFQER